MWPGTQKFENGIFPDPDLINPALYRVQQPFILSGIMAYMRLPAPPGTHNGTTVTVSVWRTPFGQTVPVAITDYSLSFSETETSKSYYNSSFTFGAKDLIHVRLQCSNVNQSNAHDITVQLDCF